MLYRITALKAPWPAGSKVGDVIDLASVPAWALGKCEPAPDAAAPVLAPAATVLVDAPAEPEMPPPEQEPEPEQVKEPEQAPEADPEPPSRDAMESEAEALGIGFNSRTSDETLIERIAKAKASQ